MIQVYSDNGTPLIGPNSYNYVAVSQGTLSPTGDTRFPLPNSQVFDALIFVRPGISSTGFVTAGPGYGAEYAIADASSNMAGSPTATLTSSPRVQSSVTFEPNARLDYAGGQWVRTPPLVRQLPPPMDYIIFRPTDKVTLSAGSSGLVLYDNNGRVILNATNRYLSIDRVETITTSSIPANDIDVSFTVTPKPPFNDVFVCINTLPMLYYWRGNRTNSLVPWWTSSLGVTRTSADVFRFKSVYTDSDGYWENGRYDTWQASDFSYGIPILFASLDW